MLDQIKTVFLRELDKVKSEISLYQDEKAIWKIDGRIANAGGNLCLHLVGNLKTYVGKELGGIPYERNREHEFAAKYIPRERLLGMLSETRSSVDTALAGLSMNDLDKTYPLLVFKEPMTTGYFLIHLVSHLSYHLGQINYHRRLIDKTSL